MEAENKNSHQKHIIAFLVDQVSPEAYFKLLDEGVAPNVMKYIYGNKIEDFTYENASICVNTCTGFPSTSANSHTSLLCGGYQGKTGMLYADYWDLTKKRPEYIDTEEIKVSLLNDLNYKFISPACKTMFEYFDDSASFHGINRGAEFKLLTTGSLLTKFLPLLLKMKKVDDPSGLNPLAQPEFWKQMFGDNISSFLKRVESKTLPEASFIVFLLTDENGHKFGFDSPHYKEALQVFDLFVQGIMEGTQDKKGNNVKGLNDLGYQDSIVWAIFTDHAARRVNRDKYVTINEIAEIELGLKLTLGTEAKQDKNRTKLKALSTTNAFSVTGVEFWQAWFGQIGENLEDFSKFHGEMAFRQVKPKAERKGERGTEKVDVIEYFLEQDYTQFVILPEDLEDYKIIPPEERIKLKIPRNYKIKIFSPEGIGTIQRQYSGKYLQFKYTFERGDPLNYGEVTKYDSWQNEREVLKNTITHEYPDVFFRLFGYFDCLYAPNFIVTAKDGYQFWSIPKIEEKRKKVLYNIQTHDGLYNKESIVPLTFSGPGIKKGYRIPIARNVDVLPTLLTIMGKNFDQGKLDGDVLTEIIE